MRFRRMLSTSVTPIAIDIGAASVKLLQVTKGDKPGIFAATELSIPEEARNNIDRRFAFLAEELPGVIKSCGFKGRRAICSPVSSHFTVQQVQVQEGGPVSIDDQIRGEVASRLGCTAANVVARSFDANEQGGEKSERVCLAIARDDVMRYVDAFKEARLDVVGVQPDQIAMMNAFRHLHRRAEDASVITMYVDAGWGAVKVVVGRGPDLVFARIIQVGGRHFDQVGSEVWGITPSEAGIRRMAEESEVSSADRGIEMPRSEHETSAVLRAGLAKARNQSMAGEDHAAMSVMTDRRNGESAPAMGSEVGVDGSPCLFSEVYDTVADELSMCARYAAAGISGGAIQRLVFLGGESRSRTLAAHLARAVGVKASVGDPLKRYAGRELGGSVDVDMTTANPGWAVACGLCATPVEM